MKTWSPRMLSVLRIMSALLFMEHGLAKLVHFPAHQPGVNDPLPLILEIGGLIEIAGGLFLTLGFFSRITAFVCSGQMAVAYFLKHAPLSFWPLLNSGDAAILMCMIFLYIAFTGPGPWAVDALKERVFEGRYIAQNLRD